MLALASLPRYPESILLMSKLARERTSGSCGHILDLVKIQPNLEVTVTAFFSKLYQRARFELH